MAYFKQLEDQLQDLLALCNKDERWLVVVNADPDSLASAMAFKRIIGRRSLKWALLISTRSSVLITLL